MTQPNSTSEKTTESSGSGLQKKIGNLPIWVYAVAVGLAIFLVIYLRRQSAAKAAADTSTTDPNATSTGTIPPFINQVYTNPTPPEASDIRTITKTVPGKPAENRKYNVQKGDTLESIAKKFYNRPTEWTVIAAENAQFIRFAFHGKKPNPKAKLPAGHVVVIP